MKEYDGDCLRLFGTGRPEAERNFFLTGEKGIGKSAVIRRILERTEGPAGGFFTVKSETVFPGRLSLHMVRPTGSDSPSLKNFLTFCGKRDSQTAARFNQVGCRILSDTAGLRLLVMDEIGPHETEAMLFRKAVLDAISGPIPILGVLQKAGSPFLAEIALHPKVKVIEVTAENRDFLAEKLCLL